MKVPTQALARASARHPWRTIVAWIVVLVLAVVALGGLLPGALTTEGKPTNNPQSERAIDVLGGAFPPDPSKSVTDIVIVRSDRHTVESPQFRTFVARLVADGRATGVVSSARTYLSTRDPSLVSRDRHATIIPISVGDVDDVPKVLDVVEKADADPTFAAAITGNQTLDNDFNKLSQEDLQNGELKFGLPAALVILLLVFGAVVAGLVPVLLAIVSIIVALGLVALLAQTFELSVFIVNMLSGMGLALGIDYSLFVISRYREERARGLEKFDAIAASGMTASRAVLFSGTAFVVAMFGMLLVPTNCIGSSKNDETRFVSGFQAVPVAVGG